MCDAQTCTGDGRTGGGHAADDPAAATLALLPDAAGLLAALHDTEGALVDLVWRSANTAAERLLGVGPLVGRRLRGDATDAACPGLFALFAMAFHQPVDQTVAAVRAAPPGSGDGLPVRWRVAATPIPGGLCATLADLGPVTAPLPASLAETLAGALEHSAEGVALFGADGRLIHANGRLKHVLPNLADLLVPGVPFEALVRRYAQTDPDLTTPAERERWIADRLDRHRRRAAPMVVPIHDGRWLLVNEHAVNGGVLVVYTDITMMKRTEERLRAREAEARAARREAENANRAKSGFLAQISHELRTPLNAVLGFSELLLSEAFGPLGSPRYRSYAGDIRDAGTHLLALIDDILALSSVDAGQAPMTDEGVDLDVLSTAIVASLEGEAAAGRVTLRRDVSADLPLLLGDAEAIGRMLANLLANAVTFTPPGGEVMVTAQLMPDGGIGLMVADTGVGIPAADLPRIVEPFERLDSEIARPSSGTGLGLPIVKRLVERHGGRLEVTSEPGTGTSAILVFPASRTLPRDLPPPSRLSPFSQR